MGVIETGNTEIVTEMLAAGTGAELFHIETVNAYPSAYEECTQAAQTEKDNKARPELIDWTRDSDIHMLIRSCVFHYEFELIHPFAGGNGRVGRLWHTMLLSKWNSAPG